MGRRCINNEIKEMIIDLALQGKSQRDIANIVGIHRNSVQRILAGNELIQYDDHDAVVKRFSDMIAEYIGDDWEYDSGYTNNRGTANIKCKHCGNVISIHVDTIRSLRRGYTPSVICDVCETIKEENKRLEAEWNAVVSEIERNEKRYAKISVLITTPREHTCKYCGNKFITYYGDKHTAFCSKTCNNRYNKRNRKKKIKHVLVDSDITLPLLAERDNDVCWLCGNKVDWNDICYTDTGATVGPMYPSIDHVLALSNGGKHSWDNVRLAHCKCNTIKSDKPIESRDDFVEVGRCG